MKIIGIDPGLQSTGFGVIEVGGNGFCYLASGAISTNPKEPLSRRLKEIFSGVSEVVARYQPDVAAVEIVFVNVNPQSTLLLGQARGAAVAALTQTIEEVYEYTALQLKKSLVGYGHASKLQIQTMVKELLGLAALPPSDAADALGLAITHAHGIQHASQLTAAASSYRTSTLRQRRGRVF